MNCVSHIQHGLWVREDTQQIDYRDMQTWVDLARLLERGGFDTLFLADVMGVYDTYRGSADTSIREAMQVPVNDPALLIPVMAYATETLGFAYTSSVLQMPPFTFARQLSTLDHLSGGRVAWNVVTSYLANGARNLGFDALPEHDERYQWADEYLEVIYQLLEGSWEDDAVVRDRVAGVYADPDKVHRIDHVGARYQVAGPHLCEPSAQRTPVLFQAGSSDRGREFAARHAECIFVMTSRSRERAGRGVVADVVARAARYGRGREDLRFYQGLTPVVGSTQAEAAAKRRDYMDYISTEGSMAHLSGSLGVDLSTIDPDEPLENLRSEGVAGLVKGLVDSAEPGARTFRDLARLHLAGQFLAGTPETIADALEDWVACGLDGFNIGYAVTPGSFRDFIEQVVPVLRERGLMRQDVVPGTLREKLFARPRLPSNHPGAAYRRGGDG